LLTLPYKNKRNLSIAETILLSILFHAAFLAYIPSQNLNQISKSVELDIDILINEPEPIEEIIPEPIKEIIPEPIKGIIPEPIKEIIKPKTITPIISSKKIIKSKPNNFVIKKTIESYSTTLAKAIAKQKKYPRIAQMRGWQGEIIIDLEIDGKGNLINSKIKQKSGFKILDKEGMAMIKRASPFPKPPKELESKIFNVIVPISFKLQP
jgi:periplasmic protein TonB